MAKNEYENGSIRFTKTGYMELMRHMRLYFNNSQAFLFESATVVYNQLNAIKGSKARQAAFDDMFTYNNGWMAKKAPYSSIYSISQDNRSDIRTELFRGAKDALCKPRKSAFAHLTNKISSFTLPIDEGNIELCQERNILYWRIGANNHAVRDARNSPVAGALFTYLNKYKWRKGEGGTFSYWSEFNNEDNDDCEDREADETTSSYFGPVGKAANDREIEMMHRRFDRR